MKIICVVIFLIKPSQALCGQWLREREFGKYWGIISESWWQFSYDSNNRNKEKHMWDPGFRSVNERAVALAQLQGPCIACHSLRFVWSWALEKKREMAEGWGNGNHRIWWWIAWIIKTWEKYWMKSRFYINWLNSGSIYWHADSYGKVDSPYRTWVVSQKLWIGCGKFKMPCDRKADVSNR